MPEHRDETPFDSPPRLVDLEQDVDDTRALWHKARSDAEQAERAYREAVRRMVDAENIFRTAAQRYEQERRWATT